MHSQAGRAPVPRDPRRKGLRASLLAQRLMALVIDGCDDRSYGMFIESTRIVDCVTCCPDGGFLACLVLFDSTRRPATPGGTKSSLYYRISMAANKTGGLPLPALYTFRWVFVARFSSFFVAGSFGVGGAGIVVTILTVILGGASRTAGISAS